MDEDQEVVRRVVAGDVESFRLLVCRYQRPLHVLIRNLVADAQDGEDIAQEVFLSAYRRLNSYDPAQGAFSTWLFSIARNKCLNALQKRRPVVLDRLPEPPAPGTPDTDVARAEWFRLLDAALDALPFAQKTAFVLAEIHGLTLEEIGQIESVPIGTVKSRLGRAKEKLRSLLRPTEQSDVRS